MISGKGGGAGTRCLASALYDKVTGMLKFDDRSNFSISDLITLVASRLNRDGAQLILIVGLLHGLQDQVAQPIQIYTMANSIGEGDLGFDSRAGKSGHSVVNDLPRLRHSCVAQALNCGYGPRHLLHASA